MSTAHYDTQGFRVELHRLVADPSRMILQFSGNDFMLGGYTGADLLPETRIRLPGIAPRELFRLGLWLAWRSLW